MISDVSLHCYVYRRASLCFNKKRPRKKELRFERVLKSYLGISRNLESVQSSKQAGTKGETIMKRPL